MQPPSRAGIYGLLLLMPLFFVSNLVIGRATASVVEPYTLAFWRWVIATALVLPIAWRGLADSYDAFRRVVPQLATLGVLGMVICGGGVYLSLRYTTATNATLIYTGSTILVVVMEAIFFRQRLSPLRLIGALIGFLGIAVIILQGDLARLFTLSLNIGDIGIAIAAFSWAVYSLILKRREISELPTLPLFAAISIAGTLVLIPPMLFEQLTYGAFPHGRDQWTAIVALAIFPSVLAFLLYQLGVKYAGPSITGMFFYLLPVYGVGLAALTLGERIAPYHIAGLLLVLGGVVLATEPFKKSKAPPTA
jgi:drug/metabolite transporter (DMT)-like permease